MLSSLVYLVSLSGSSAICGYSPNVNTQSRLDHLRKLAILTRFDGHYTRASLLLRDTAPHFLSSRSAVSQKKFLMACSFLMPYYMLLARMRDSGVHPLEQVSWP
ncbi:hypothetical protein F5Y03DRAFT_178616 [Xylaria venustula]|nr:hypothetical protein F5Y03DRAFT_178616 [Xylaria venustula]